MKKRLALVCALLVSALLALPALAQEEAPNPIGELPWQNGPAQGAIGTRAKIAVPEGYAFLGAEGTHRLEELLENPASDDDLYTFAPENLSWIAFFSFSEVGYVKDDESIDAESILSSVSEATEQANIARRDRGWESLHVLGWSFEPKYDKGFNALEWAILAETRPSKGQIVNYNTRLLGRHGVMHVTVVTEPQLLDASIADFKKQMPGYQFASGESYAEFKAGDHVAEIGLAALITGGAAAVASKKGFFAAIAIALAKFWKLVMVAIFAGGVAIRKLFKGRSRNGPTVE